MYFNINNIAFSLHGIGIGTMSLHTHICLETLAKNVKYTKPSINYIFVAIACIESILIINFEVSIFEFETLQLQPTVACHILIYYKSFIQGLIKKFISKNIN